MSSKSTPKAAEPRDYCLVIRRRGGGFELIEGEVAAADVTHLRSHAPDALDQTMGRLMTAIERRFLR